MTTRDNAPLGKRILGFQHFGLTVQNMDRAYAFYTDVLGGTEVMRDGDFHGEKIQNLWVQEQHGPRRTSTGVPRILVLYTSVFTYVMMSTSTNSSTTLKLKPRGGA